MNMMQIGGIKMGLFSNKKKLCPVCGEPTPRLFPTKVDDTALCKECAKKIYLPDGKLGQMTIDEFLQYMNFYEENQSLRERFTKTYDSKNAGIVLDETNRLFRLRDESAALVFEVSSLKSFRILEDSTVLFESQANGLRCYESDIPNRARQLAGVIGEFKARRKEYEFRKDMERRREENAKRRGEEYQKQYIPMPSLGCDEPFQNFYVELILEHPYWSDFRMEICGPRFQYDPSVEGYICDYENEAGRMHELAMNLMQFICPGAQEIHDGEVQNQSVVTRQAVQTTGSSVIEEIKQYKELLDAGIITEEEFAAKKRQLLGL